MSRTGETVDSGQWSVVSGQWSVVSGQWTVDSGQWSGGLHRILLSPTRGTESWRGDIAPCEWGEAMDGSPAQPIEPCLPLPPSPGWFVGSYFYSMGYGDGSPLSILFC